MSGLDIGMAVILAVCSVYGLWKGFVRIAIGMAGLGVSLALALRLAARGPQWFAGVFASGQIARVVAFVLVLVCGLLLTGLAAWLARKLVASAELGWVDRLVGATVGLAGGCLGICGLLVGLTAFLPPGSAVLGESVLLPYAITVSDLAARILPPDVARLYYERRRALEERRREVLPPASMESRRRGGRERHPS
ncbi:MAG: CvpA family protein [Acidobacteriota bacterium]|nr:CvpA family protein [Acidobacteriota bacterium]